MSTFRSIPNAPWKADLNRSSGLKAGRFRQAAGEARGAQPTTLRTIYRLVVLTPALLWPYIAAEVEQAAAWLPAGFAPKDVTPIVLELPLFAMTPPLNDELWNPLIATARVPAGALVIDPECGHPNEVSLTRVFVEFSPLEMTVWDGVEADRGGTTFTRGAYLEREDDDYAAWLVDQTFPAGTRSIHGPYRFGVRRDRTSKNSACSRPPARRTI
jgi:hypothetical protein